VFLEITEKSSSPISGFSGGTELAFGRAKRCDQGKKSLRTAIGRSTVTFGDKLNPIQEPKLKSWIGGGEMSIFQSKDEHESAIWF
jgi:hypothetical protein